MRASSDSSPTAQISVLAECVDELVRKGHDSRPLSTYRLQFHKDFRFTDAKNLVPYLHALGISHVYSSPFLKARAGSIHGYDITDHNLLNPEIGTLAELQQFVDELHRHGMGQILDTVPNHMGVGLGDNPWWMDVLQNGRAAEHAEFFDIDWHPLKPELHNKLLLPILGRLYGEELEDGNLRLEFWQGVFRLAYYDRYLPIDPQTIPLIFAQAMVDGDSPRSDLRILLRELAGLPNHAEDSDAAKAKRRQLVPMLLHRLRKLHQDSEAVQESISRAATVINGTPGDPASFDALHHVLEAQVYRLAYWRVSAEEINYRRFFDVNDLVGLRMENPAVFAATHRLLRRLMADGSINGIRIDHCDGLLNPRQYLIRAQMLYCAAKCIGAEAQPPLAENGIEEEIVKLLGHQQWHANNAPLFTLVEKILEPDEDLPTEWPVDGTSGYEFTNLLNGIFIQKKNERAFSNLYHRFAGAMPNVDTLIYENKKLIMNTALSSEVNVLTHILDELSGNDRRARDFTRKTLREAIRETIACFPVYRSYIDERGEIAAQDQSYIHDAIARAKRRNAGLSTAVFDFLRDILLLKGRAEDSDDELHRRKLHFVLKFQQLTGPVMAKGLEDTVCYVYNRFISVNEVGGSPKVFGHTLEQFHCKNAERAERWPHSMLATSTHDTKRSEDVRARLNVLSEMPKEWSQQVLGWRRANRRKKKVLGDGRAVPDRNEEYLLYQTLVGSWPLRMQTEDDREQFIQRICAYMTKSIHEAKVNLSWINTNPEYVDAMNGFIRRILTPDPNNTFLPLIEGFLPPVQYSGCLNSVGQALLKMTVPGLPDVYQGNELFDFSLVDPDNRRQVDYGLRRRYAEELGRVTSDGMRGVCAELLENHDDGRIKLWTTMRSLRFRRQNPGLFRGGKYIPLHPSGGDAAKNLCTFARGAAGQMAVVAVPRFNYSLMRGGMSPPLADIWAEAEIPLPDPPSDYFENIFTGEVVKMTERGTLRCREVFAGFPVALLTSR